MTAAYLTGLKVTRCEQGLVNHVPSMEMAWSSTGKITWEVP